MRRLHLAIALLAALLCVTAVLAATTRATYISCTVSNACFPWNTQGPACGRGANINMRFQVQLNPANYVTVSGSVVSNVTYAFCPRVDELQAFNISSVGSLTYTYVSSNNGTIMLMDGVRDTAWVSAIGFGNTDDVNFPQEGSAGRVMIADVFSYNNAGRSQCPDGQMGIVPFLVMNITLNNGKFQYFDGYNYPAGSGFVPSCDSGEVCLFDSASPCIGPRGGRKNCGQCVNAVDARNSLLQIWASYYGTDSQGRTLRSGASNPLNFQAYSGSGVASSMRKSFSAAQNGQQLGSDSLQAG